jgi:uncharacterized protein
MADQDTRDRSGLQIIAYEECLRLLREHYVGRIGFVENGEVAILPVNYRLLGTSVVFRTSVGGKLHAAERERPASFQIDGFDELYQSGWSVLVKGTVASIDDPDTLAQLEEVPLTPWAAAQERPYWVRLIPHEITGRRI